MTDFEFQINQFVKISKYLKINYTASLAHFCPFHVLLPTAIRPMNAPKLLIE